jgi:hypothetical protein
MLIFLDIDGVLVHAGNHNSAVFLNWDFDPECVAVLNHLIESVNDPQIVLSSAWRMFGMEKMNKKLGMCGVKAKIIGLTGHDKEGIRGKEIADVLTDFPGMEYLIIDDSIEDIVEFHPRSNIIHVDNGWYTDGLKNEHVDFWLKIYRGEHGIIEC